MAETTYVKKYFNPHTYPVQLAISELNQVLHVPPREAVRDSRNTAINDPLLDRFVGPQGLQPEISSTPVPVVRLTARATPVVSNSGYVVGQGHKDVTGRWVPPTSAAVPAAAAAAKVQTPSGSTPLSVRESVRGMSIEEAKKRGFIGKAQRIIPEDYGTDETTGAPLAGKDIPEIRVSMESRPQAVNAQGAPLPAELTQGVTPTVAPLLASMAAAAQQNTEASVPAIAEQAPVTQEAVRRVAEVVVPSRVVASPGPVLPPPNLEPPPPVPATVSEMTYTCGGCGKTFKSEAWLRKHVASKHRDRLNELSPHEIAS